jgi:adenine-specific DNA-methyltransferase
MTDKYSPHGPTNRKFFTIENAKIIDYLRNRIEALKPTLKHDDYKFLLASLLLSADAVSNVPAVYGCYLHNFKSKANKQLVLKPVHTNTVKPIKGSKTYANDVLVLPSVLKKTDIVYLDPPYNGRQYSKNYFPLNMLALSPEEQEKVPPLKGKTGIPESCFISPFCKKGQAVEDAFDSLFKNLKTDWIFLSYNSESTLSKEKMLSLLTKYGEASVVERDYKRFKSYEYNNDVQIKEYLFALHKI